MIVCSLEIQNNFENYAIVVMVPFSLTLSLALAYEQVTTNSTTVETTFGIL